MSQLMTSFWQHSDYHDFDAKLKVMDFAINRSNKTGVKFWMVQKNHTCIYV